MREFEFKLWKLKVEELEFKLREFEFKLRELKVKKLEYKLRGLGEEEEQCL